MDPTTVIQDTEFTIGDILKSLEENCPEFQEFVKVGVKVTSYSSETVSENKGHGSIVRKLTLNLSSGDKFSVALKIPTIAFFIKIAKEKNMDLKPIVEPAEKMLSTLHGRECQFFDNIAGLFDRIRLPNVYKTQKWIPGEQQGCILMEDLSRQGTVQEKGYTLTKEQVLDVVKILARFHVQAWETEDIWKGKYLGGQETWADMSSMYSQSLKGVEEIIERNCTEETTTKLKRYIEVFQPVIANRDLHIWAYKDAHVEYNVKPVICHGDVWLCNLFWHNDSPSELLSFIDWQLFHEGSPAVDLARLLILNLDGPVRKEFEQTIFDYYMDCIKSELKGKEAPFTVEQLRKCYNAVFPTQGAAFFSIVGFAFEEPNASKEKLINMIKFVLEDVYTLLTGELEAISNKFSQAPNTES